MARAKAVEIRGLNEFVREINKAEDAGPRVMKEVNKVVAEAVVDDGTDELKTSGHPVLRHVARLGGTSIKAGSTANRGFVKLNARSKRNAPTLGAELGSKRFRQFKRYKAPRWVNGLPTGGYGVHKAIRKHVTKYRDRYGAALDELYRSVFPD